PWHSKQAESQVSTIKNITDVVERFTLTGIRPNYKCSATKLMWLKQNTPDLLKNSVWLSTADYIVYRLTGAFTTDPSLAGRTYAFRLDQRDWDRAWLETIGLPVEIFAPVNPSSKPFPSIAD